VCGQRFTIEGWLGLGNTDSLPDSLSSSLDQLTLQKCGLHPRHSHLRIIPPASSPTTQSQRPPDASRPAQLQPHAPIEPAGVGCTPDNLLSPLARLGGALGRLRFLLHWPPPLDAFRVALRQHLHRRRQALPQSLRACAHAQTHRRCSVRQIVQQAVAQRRHTGTTSGRHNDGRAAEGHDVPVSGHGPADARHVSSYPCAMPQPAMCYHVTFMMVALNAACNGTRVLCCACVRSLLQASRISLDREACEHSKGAHRLPLAACLVDHQGIPVFV
jgi:hypothetical protein